MDSDLYAASREEYRYRRRLIALIRAHQQQFGGLTPQIVRYLYPAFPPPPPLLLPPPPKPLTPPKPPPSPPPSPPAPPKPKALWKALALSWMSEPTTFDELLLFVENTQERIVVATRNLQQIETWNSQAETQNLIQTIANLTRELEHWLVDVGAGLDLEQFAALKQLRFTRAYLLQMLSSQDWKTAPPPTARFIEQRCDRYLNQTRDASNEVVQVILRKLKKDFRES